MYESDQIEEQGSVFSSVGSSAASQHDSPQAKSDCNMIPQPYVAASKPSGLTGCCRRLYGQEISQPPPAPQSSLLFSSTTDGFPSGDHLYQHLSQVCHQLPAAQTNYAEMNGTKVPMDCASGPSNIAATNPNQSSLRVTPNNFFQLSGSPRKSKPMEIKIMFG